MRLKNKLNLIKVKLLTILLAISLTMSLGLFTACNNHRGSLIIFPPSFASVFYDFAPLTAEIEAGSQRGTGFIVSQNTNYLYVATNYHVIEDYIADQSISISINFSYTPIEFYIGSFNQESIALVGYNTLFDIAVLRINVNLSASCRSQISHRVPLFYRSAFNTPVATASEILAIGNMDGAGISAFGGLLSNTNRIVDFGENAPPHRRHLPVYQLSIGLNPGVSGGPVFSVCGNFVGIASFYAVADSSGRPLQNVGFAIPASIAMPIINSIIANPSYSEANTLFMYMPTQNQLTIPTFAGLTLQRMGNDLFVSSVGNRPAIASSEWFNVGDRITHISNLSTENATFSQIIGALKHYSVDGTGSPLRITTQRGTEVSFSNLQRISIA